MIGYFYPFLICIVPIWKLEIGNHCFWNIWILNTFDFLRNKNCYYKNALGQKNGKFEDRIKHKPNIVYKGPWSYNES